MKTTLSVRSPAFTTVISGAVGLAVGVTGPEGTEVGPSPTALVAATV
ncbi:unannotated protein [freshwater metagenome]|uniref:Unannotated protein n=1 Tax=freshwater metagenome TaxID=449393 RepID=A0A6J7HVP0_9ZZZZ